MRVGNSRDMEGCTQDQPSQTLHRSIEDSYWVGWLGLKRGCRGDGGEELKEHGRDACKTSPVNIASVGKRR